MYVVEDVVVVGGGCFLVLNGPDHQDGQYYDGETFHFISSKIEPVVQFKC